MAEVNIKKGTIYLVGTPIGNLDEITPRALDTLSMVDVIFAEDTRVSKKLLMKFNIKTKLISLYNQNYQIKLHDIKKYLIDGESVALISDAGMPGISDPGYEVVRGFADEYKVVPISGPCALVNSLVGSKLPANPFLFIGFLPRTNKQTILKKYLSFEGTIICYESPNRVVNTLKEIAKVYGDVQCSIARELTKVHETFYYGTVSSVINQLPDPLQGEIVICIYKTSKDVSCNLTLKEQLQFYLSQGISEKEAHKFLAKDNNLHKREVYNILLKEKHQ